MDTLPYLLKSGFALYVSGYSAMAVFAIFAAYWAQQTQRNPWLWFAFGLVLTPIAGLALLWLNARRHAVAPRTQDNGRSDLLAVHKDIV